MALFCRWTPHIPRLLSAADGLLISDHCGFGCSCGFGAGLGAGMTARGDGSQSVRSTSKELNDLHRVLSPVQMYNAFMRDDGCPSCFFSYSSRNPSVPTTPYPSRGHLPLLILERERRVLCRPRRNKIMPPKKLRCFPTLTKNKSVKTRSPHPKGCEMDK